MASKQIRPIRVEGNVAYVPLTQGYEAIIDAADVPLVEGKNWSALVSRNRQGVIRTVYARHDVGPRGDRESVLMHRLLAGATGAMDVDHRDSNGLNNRRKNIRAATRTQNNCNQRRSIANKSGFKGVYWFAARGKWCAEINVSGKRKRLGYFLSIEDAAAAYAAASADLHGEFSRMA